MYGVVVYWGVRSEHINGGATLSRCKCVSIVHCCVVLPLARDAFLTFPMQSLQRGPAPAKRRHYANRPTCKKLLRYPKSVYCTVKYEVGLGTTATEEFH